MRGSSARRHYRKIPIWPWERSHDIMRRLPGVPEDERTSTRVIGVAQKLMDSSAIGNRPLIDSFEGLAKDAKITTSLFFHKADRRRAIPAHRGGYTTMDLVRPHALHPQGHRVLHKTDCRARRFAGPRLDNVSRAIQDPVPNCVIIGGGPAGSGGEGATQIGGRYTDRAKIDFQR